MPSRVEQEPHERPASMAERIIASVREPFLVLDQHLRVKSANRAFYLQFQATPDETEGRCVCDLGNGRWDLPDLRSLLQEALANHHPVQAI